MQYCEVANLQHLIVAKCYTSSFPTDFIAILSFYIAGLIYAAYKVLNICCTCSADRGEPAVTKRICGFDARLVLGPVIPKT